MTRKEPVGGGGAHGNEVPGRDPGSGGARPGHRNQSEAGSRAGGAGGEGLLAAVAGTLARGEPVRLPGLGIFEAKRLMPRTARNPRTGRPVDVPASRIARFRPGTQLRGAVKPERPALDPEVAARRTVGGDAPRNPPPDRGGNRGGRPAGEKTAQGNRRGSVRRRRRGRRMACRRPHAGAAAPARAPRTDRRCAPIAGAGGSLPRTPIRGRWRGARMTRRSRRADRRRPGSCETRAEARCGSAESRARRQDA